MTNFDMVLIILAVFAALGPGYLIGQFFSTDEKGYWGYVWKGVWISALVLVGLALLFYFAVQMVENPS